MGAHRLHLPRAGDKSRLRDEVSPQWNPRSLDCSASLCSEEPALPQTTGGTWCSACATDDCVTRCSSQTITTQTIGSALSLTERHLVASWRTSQSDASAT
uniref:Uncharacterized protein n=1 Tax=Cacopsylla melanoneura TaxID=428564 RepID=A0A8D9ALJ6_9HEMI